MGSGGGKQETTTVDPVYNAGMLELSQEQQQWAKEMYNMFKHGVPYDPSEQVYGTTIDGKFVPKDQLGETGMTQDYMVENPEWKLWNDKKRALGQTDPVSGITIPSTYNIGPEPERWLINEDRLESRTRGDMEGYDPNAQVSEMQYLQNLVEANQELLGLRTDTEKAQLEYMQSGLEKRTPVRDAFYDAALTGIDAGKRADQAQAEVQHGFKLADQANRMDIAGYGLDPGAGRFAALNRGTAMAEASGVAGARTAATERAEQESFDRLRAGLSME